MTKTSDRTNKMLDQCETHMETLVDHVEWLDNEMRELFKEIRILKRHLQKKEEEAE